MTVGGSYWKPKYLMGDRYLSNFETKKGNKTDGEQQGTESLAGAWGNQVAPAALSVI